MRRPAARTGVAYRSVSQRDPKLRALIENSARVHGVPTELVQRVVMRESSHQPTARNGPYYGLMQILPQTAQTMGYRGSPEGLLDAETNLTYAVKYLRGAWLVSGGDHDEAVGWYLARLLLRGEAPGPPGGDRPALGEPLPRAQSFPDSGHTGQGGNQDET